MENALYLRKMKAESFLSLCLQLESKRGIKAILHKTFMDTRDVALTPSSSIHSSSATFSSRLSPFLFGPVSPVSQGQSVKRFFLCFSSSSFSLFIRSSSLSFSTSLSSLSLPSSRDLLLFQRIKGLSFWESRESFQPFVFVHLDALRRADEAHIDVCETPWIDACTEQWEVRARRHACIDPCWSHHGKMEKEKKFFTLSLVSRVSRQRAMPSGVLFFSLQMLFACIFQEKGKKDFSRSINRMERRKRSRSIRTGREGLIVKIESFLSRLSPLWRTFSPDSYDSV